MLAIMNLAGPPINAAKTDAPDKILPWKRGHNACHQTDHVSVTGRGLSTAMLRKLVDEGGWPMVTLTDALAEARQKRQSKYKELTLRWQMAQEVLRALGERLASADLPRWYFIPNGEEIVVVHHQPGGTKERVGSWVVDEEYRLSFGDEKTEWISGESWKRVLDKAVMITAEAILDRELQPIPIAPALVTRSDDQRLLRQPDNAG
jgi:hypothetical protein